jgi:hypothetical protein
MNRTTVYEVGLTNRFTSLQRAPPRHAAVLCFPVVLRPYFQSSTGITASWVSLHLIPPATNHSVHRPSLNVFCTYANMFFPHSNSHSATLASDTRPIELNEASPQKTQQWCQSAISKSPLRWSRNQRRCVPSQMNIISYV